MPNSLLLLASAYFLPIFQKFIQVQPSAHTSTVYLLSAVVCLSAVPNRSYKEDTLQIVGARYSQAGCPFCQPTNSTVNAY